MVETEDAVETGGDPAPGRPAGMTAASPDLTPTHLAMDGRDWTFGGTWPYEPKWLFTDTVRLHYVDEGRSDGKPVVLLHGTPYWSYVFREEIALLAASGHRVIAYDQLGFGRSDKPSRESEYSLERDVRHLRALIEELDLVHPTLIAQGSAIPIARAFGEAEIVERDEPPLPDVARSRMLGPLVLKAIRIPFRQVGWERTSSYSPTEKAAYLAPHPSWASRSGIVASLRRAESA